MTLLTAHAALGMMVCACVLMAPHLDSRTGLRLGVLYFLLAGASGGTFTWLVVAEMNRAVVAEPTHYYATLDTDVGHAQPATPHR